MASHILAFIIIGLGFGVAGGNRRSAVCALWLMIFYALTGWGYAGPLLLDLSLRSGLTQESIAHMPWMALPLVVGTLLAVMMFVLVRRSRS